MFSYSKGNTYTLLAKVQAICMQATPAPQTFVCCDKTSEYSAATPSSLLSDDSISSSNIKNDCSENKAGISQIIW